MRWTLLLGLLLGFLTSLALLPEAGLPEAAQAEIASARKRGFNEGYESGSREVMRVVELRKLGEYYFDHVNQRPAFRWYCDEDAAVERLEDAPGSTVKPEEPPRRMTQQTVARRSAG